MARGSAIARFVFGLALIAPTLIGPAAPVGAQGFGPSVTFSPATVAVGDNLSVSYGAASVNCNNPVTVDIVTPSPPYMSVGTLGRTTTAGCYGSFTNQVFRVPTLTGGPGTFRVRVVPDGFASQTGISANPLTVTGSAPGGLSGTAQCNVPPLTVIPNAIVNIYSGAALVASTAADGNGAWSLSGTASYANYVVRYTSPSGNPTCDVRVTTDASGSGIAPTPAVCPPGEQTGVPNTNWKRAKEISLTPNGTPAVTTINDSLCRFRQSRWYKIRIQPGQRVTAEVTNPSFDATLALFKDISKTAAALTPQPNQAIGLNDVQRVNAGLPKRLVAPDETSPDETSGEPSLSEVTAPDETSPDETSPDETSPDETSPDFATPDETSPDETSPDETSDLYSVAQTHSILAYSDKPGNASEVVRRHTWDNTGYFYVRVHGHNGAFDDTTPFSLKLTLENRHCLSNGTLQMLNNPQPTFIWDAPVPRTLILTNTARFPAGSDIDGLMASLNAYAARGEVGGQVVDLAGDPTLDAVYAQWLDDPRFVDCVPAANIVVDQIHAVEQIIAGNSGQLRAVVLAGSDRVVPFQRIPDTAGLGPEKNYSPAVLDNSVSQASLRSNYFLSQDIYGSLNQISRLDHNIASLDIPVGRLVENVPDIQTQVASYIANNGVITPSSSLVTGYDFLTPAALSQRDDLAASTGSTPDTLIQQFGFGPGDPAAWSAKQLRDKLFSPTTSYGVIALNAHFSGNSLLAADEASHVNDINSSRVKSREMAAVTDGRYSNTLFLSMGCHSGYNIVDGDATPGTQPVDWAQAIAQQGGTLVGGTGYQYGSSPVIKYSEVLLANLVHELRFTDGDAGPVSLGQAIVNTKRNYVHQDMTGTDEKAMSQLTLYGLPTLGVNLPTGRLQRTAPPSLISSPPVPSPTSPGLSKTQILPSYRLTGHDQVLQKVNTEGSTSTTATYFDATLNGTSLAPDAQTMPGQPIIPQIVGNVAVGGTLARGAILMSASYTDMTSSLNGANRFRPLIDTPATEHRSVRPAYGASIFTPRQILGLSEFDGQFLAVRPFQFASDFDARQNMLSVFGSGRRYNSLNAEIYYSNRTDSSAFNGPPVVYNTRLSLTEGGDLLVDATIGGPLYGGVPDVEEVFATYTGESNAHCDCNSPFYGTWSSIRLNGGTPTTNSIGFIRHYTGLIALQRSSASLVDVVIQAVGGNGLVSIASNNGQGYSFSRESATLSRPKTATSLKFQPESGTSYSAQYRGTLNVSAKLTNAGPGPSTGTPVTFRQVTFSFGRARVAAITDTNGLASARLPVLLAPGDFPLPRVTVSFDEDQQDLASGDTRDVVINKDETFIQATPRTPVYGSAADTATLYARIPGRNTPLRETGVRLTLNDGRVLDTITDGLGRVLFDTLDFEGVQPGTYTVRIDFLGNDRYLPSSSTLSQSVTAGRNHSAFFDGVGGYAEAPHTPELNVSGAGGWTVETWFKDEDPNGFNHPYAGILSKGDIDADPESPYYVTVGLNELLVGQRAGWIFYQLHVNLSRVDPAGWHHIAASYDARSRTLTAYLDGVQVGQRTFQAGSVGNTLPVEIGRNGAVTGKYFAGKVDDVRIWNVVRSATDIQNNLNTELSSTPAGLVANWKFNEPLGTFLAYSNSQAPHTAVLTTTGAGFSEDVPHP